MGSCIVVRLFGNILLTCLCFIIFEGVSVIDANAETSSEVSIDTNTRLRNRKKIEENEKKIKLLQANLDEAIAETKKLEQEKKTYIEKAQSDIETVEQEKQTTINELNAAKENVANTKDSLDSSIENLKKQLAQKEAERDALSTQLQDNENARKEFESQAKTTFDDEEKKYTAQISELKNEISEKTKQLNEKTTELKELNDEYKVLKDEQAEQMQNFATAEAGRYVDLEILKGEVRKLKTELKILVTKAKEIESEKDQQLQQIVEKNAEQRLKFVNQIKSLQDNELKNLNKIEELNNLIYRLNVKNRELENAGRALESRLKAKIEMLENQLTTATKKYELIIQAYADAEAKNLFMIDSLKSELNDAVSKNRSLLQVAEKLYINAEDMRNAKAEEDIADSALEAKTLLEVDKLTNQLNGAIQKNRILVDNMQKMKAQVDKLKDNSAASDQRYRNDIDTLTKELEHAATEFKKLSTKYNNRGIWTKEEGAFSRTESSELFENKSPVRSRELPSKTAAPVDAAETSSDQYVDNSSDSKAVNQNWFTDNLLPEWKMTPTQSLYQTQSSPRIIPITYTEVQDDGPSDSSPRSESVRETLVLPQKQAVNTSLPVKEQGTPRRIESLTNVPTYSQSSSLLPENNTQSKKIVASQQNLFHTEHGRASAPSLESVSFSNSRNAVNLSDSGRSREALQLQKTTAQPIRQLNNVTEPTNDRTTLQGGQNSLSNQVSQALVSKKQSQVVSSPGDQEVASAEKKTIQSSQQSKVVSVSTPVETAAVVAPAQPSQSTSVKVADAVHVTPVSNPVKANFQSVPETVPIKKQVSSVTYTGSNDNLGGVKNVQTPPVQQKTTIENLSTAKTSSSPINTAQSTQSHNPPQQRSPQNEDLVNFAVDVTLTAIQKITNYDVDKTNAVMNLIGAGAELSGQLNAIMEAIKDQYNPEIFELAIKEIERRYAQRKNFVNESMTHLYGASGPEITNWAVEIS